MWRLARAPIALLLATTLACASESAYLKRGRQLAAGRQYDAAIKQLMLAVSENPNSPAANLEVGRVYLALGRNDEAIKAIEQARKHSETEEVLVALAMAYAQAKDLKKASATMDQVLKMSPQNAVNHYRMGLIRRDMIDLAHAIESFQMAAQLDPKMAEARVELGLALKELKRTDEAIEALKGAVKDFRGAGHSLAAVQDALAESYEASGLLDYAVHTYGLALKIDPKFLPALLGTGRVLIAQNRLEEAIASLTDALTKVPKNPQLYLMLGLAYRDYHLEAQAIEALTHAIEPPSPQADAYLPLLDLLGKAKAPADTIAHVLDQAATALPTDFDLQLRAGDSALSRKDTRRAVEDYKRCVEIQPSNVDATVRLTTAQLRNGDYADAKQNIGVLKMMDGAKADELSRDLDKLAAPKPIAPPVAAPPPKDRGKKKAKPPVKHGR